MQCAQAHAHDSYSCNVRRHWNNAVGQMAEIRHVLVSTKGILTEACEDPEFKPAFNCFHHAVEKDKEHSEVPFCRLFVHLMQTRS